MTNDRRTVIAGISAAGIAATLPSGVMADNAAPLLAGVWNGILPAGPTVLRLQLEIGPDGAAVLTSIDQGMARIPGQLANSEGAGETITVIFPPIGASYAIEQRSSGGLAGRFTQNGQTYALTMVSGAATVTNPADSLSGPMSDKLLHQLRTQMGTPGVWAGWRIGNSTRTILVDGLRSADAEASVQPGDSWHVGSITKSFTATLVARAVEAGIVGWESTVGSVLGAAIPDIHPGFADVTMLHLLSHRSGLPAGAGESALADYPLELGDTIHADRIRFARSVLSVAPATPMGSAMTYANAGYVTAGAMLEELTGKVWEELIAEHVFGPLALASAGFGLPGTEGLVDQPVSHTIGIGGKRIPHFTDLPAMLGPAGLVHMNPSDMLAYLAAHRDRPGQLLRMESWAKLHTPPFGGDYALGWIVLPGGVLMHNGSNGSWLSIALVAPGKNLVAGFAGNDSAAMSRQPDIVRSLLAVEKEVS